MCWTKGYFTTSKDGHHFAVNILKSIFLDEELLYLYLNFSEICPINNK